MRAAGIERFGGEVRMLELAAPGSPGPDELVISVRAAGVANWDEFVRSGQWDVGRQPVPEPLAVPVPAPVPLPVPLPVVPPTPEPGVPAGGFFVV